MPDMEIETVEVTTSPIRTWQDGIRMIPAIRFGKQPLAGFKLSRPMIISFLNENCGDS